MFVSCLRAADNDRDTLFSQDLEQLEFLLADLQLFIDNRGAAAVGKQGSELPIKLTFTWDDLLKRGKAITRQFLELYLKSYHQDIDAYELFYYDDILSLRKVTVLSIIVNIFNALLGL